MSSRRGFTIVELLVVVAIIALLISLLLPSLGGAKESARQAKCLSNIRGLGTMMLSYAGDHHGYIPAAVPWPFGDWMDFRVGMTVNTPGYPFEKAPGYYDTMWTGFLYHKKYLRDTNVLACPSDKIITGTTCGVDLHNIMTWFVPNSSPIMTQSYGHNYFGFALYYYEPWVKPELVKKPARTYMLTSNSDNPLDPGYAIPHDTANDNVDAVTRHRKQMTMFWGDGHASMKRYSDVMARSYYWFMFTGVVPDEYWYSSKL